ncbi:MAG: hypothetical protein AAF664_25765, partial [Planctomycetota bacterium]
MKCLFLAWALMMSSVAVASDLVVLPSTKDNSIVLVEGEWRVNAGKQGRIRVKGNQHLVAMDFDTKAIRGRRVKAAELVCSKGDQTIAAVSLSTIAVPWSETESNALTSGLNVAGHSGATHGGTYGWGYPGGKFPAVTGGNAFTIVHQAKSELVDGCYYWDVAP